MTDLKKLQEMAKNGEVSKKLLVNAVGALFGAACGSVLSGMSVIAYQLHNIKKADNDWSDEDIKELSRELSENIGAVDKTLPYVKRASQFGAGVGGLGGLFVGSEYGNRIGHKACVAMGLEKS